MEFFTASPVFKALASSGLAYELCAQPLRRHVISECDNLCSFRNNEQYVIEIQIQIPL